MTLRRSAFCRGSVKNFTRSLVKARGCVGVAAVWAWGTTNAGTKLVFALDANGQEVWSLTVASGNIPGDGNVTGQGIALNHDSSVLWLCLYGSGQADRGIVRKINAATGAIQATVDIDAGDDDTDLTGIEGFPGGGFAVAGIKNSVDKVWKYGSDLVEDWNTSTSVTGVPYCVTIGIADDVFLSGNANGDPQIEKLRASDGVSQATRHIQPNDLVRFISGSDSGIICMAQELNNADNGIVVNETLTGQVDFSVDAGQHSWFVRADGTVFFAQGDSATQGLQQFDNTVSPPTEDWSFAKSGAQSAQFSMGADVHPNGRFGSADGGIYLSQRLDSDGDGHIIFITVDAGDASVTEVWDRVPSFGGSSMDKIWNVVCKPHKNVAT